MQNNGQKAMNDLMESIDTTSKKLSFSLNWKPKVATGDETEVDTRELVIF